MVFDIFLYSPLWNRRQIDAEHIAILCDIKKKHSAHSITSDVSIYEMAKAAEFFRSDGVIITGSSTGQEANPVELGNVREAIGIWSYLLVSRLSVYWFKMFLH